MILRKDLSGAQEWMAADWLTRSRMVSRLSGRKMSSWTRFVNSNVFVGTGADDVVDELVFCRPERSRVRLDERLDRSEEVVDAADEASEEEEDWRERVGPLAASVDAEASIVCCGCVGR